MYVYDSMKSSHSAGPINPLEGDELLQWPTEGGAQACAHTGALVRVVQFNLVGVICTGAQRVRVRSNMCGCEELAAAHLGSGVQGSWVAERQQSVPGGPLKGALISQGPISHTQIL